MELAAAFSAYILMYFGYHMTKLTVAKINENNKEKRRKNEAKAVELYIETGEKDKAFHYLSRRTTHAAERKRKVRIKKKTKESCFTKFSAFCECPSCGAYDIHYIKQTRVFGFKFSGCLRECRECSFTWRQK